ncbi:hypothetical protein [Comamonas terrigena]|uniref:hypothetical protein n=1 Tax=Comamonas terrigena TaxID=32013 RepID=UPI00289F1CAF|nr:hypothetical protein [Comamonas terrigena]
MLLAKLRALLPAILLVLALGGVFQYQRVQISRADARAEAAEARAALSHSGYMSAMDALSKLEQEGRDRKAKSDALAKELALERTRVKEKLIYIEREPEPATCPDAIDYLVRFGAELEGAPK